MNSLILKLKPLAEPTRPSVAWFLAGDDLRLWIEEICRWEIAHKGLRLFVVPRSQTDRSPAGVLVVPSSGSQPKNRPRGMAFGIVAGKLYLPIDADLYPPVDPTELQLLHDIQIFHPAFGMSGFAEKEGMRLCDLLRQSPSRVEDWNFAQPGALLNEHLRSVQLAAPPLQDLFGDASLEIGSESPNELPPTPGEPADGKTDKFARGTKEFFNKFLLSALQKLPHTGPRRTWVNDLEEWAAKNLRMADQNLDISRNKELHRLLHQLKENPEQGLRHAIPLNSPLHRGIAPPANRLGPRDPNFNLGRLSGGSAADFWNIPSHLEQQLRTTYRELANREMQLGRHRRAAYIFAELLGDLESAASALKQGRHFTEAAILYKDHLHRPREAAACLAEGGQFMEAIAIYEKEQCYMEIGNLYAQLGQKQEASDAFRRQAEKFLEANDFISAAKLIETELESPREALGILNLGLQHQPQALQCLEASFELMARKAWHREALELIASCNKPVSSKSSISPVARLLGKQSHIYPDHIVQHSAADMVKILASRRLQVAAPSEAILLTDALVKLAPEDRLLARDAVRFMARRNEEFRAKTKSRPVKPAGVPVLVRTFDLGKDFDLHAVKSCGPCFFAFGYSNDCYRLFRGNWEGLVQQIAWPRKNWPDVITRSLFLEVDESSCPPAMAVVSSSTPIQQVGRFPETPLPAEDQFGAVVPAGTPDWIPTDFAALCWRGNLAWLLRLNAGLILECRHRDGRMIMNTQLEGVQPELGDSIRHVSLLVQREMVWIALNRKLFLHRPGKALREWEAETDILSLQSSAPHLPLCALSRLQRGVALHWFHSLEDTINNICTDLESPLACFTGNGTLVLLSENEGRICEVSRDSQAESPFNWPGEKPLALVRAQNSDEFAVFTRTGKVQLFRVQRPGSR